MPKNHNGNVQYENEETYDNFDPKRDDLEWSKMIKKRDKDINSDHKQKDRRTNCCTEKFEQIYNSYPFNACIIALIVLECFFVAGEIIVNYIDTHLYKSHSELKNKTFILSKQSYLELISRNETVLHSQDNLDLGFVKSLEVIELICKYGGLIILLIFVIEILMKLTFIPRNCCNFFEIFDFFIVFTAFSSNLYLMVIGVTIHGMSGLLTILRIWRIKEIVNAIIKNQRYKHEAEQENLKKRIKELENSLVLKNIDQNSIE